MNSTLETRALQAGITLSGSVIAVPHPAREDTARELLAADHWVHADIIGGSYLGQPGVSYDDVDTLARIDPSRLDVHLMVDDLADGIRRLPEGLGRITLQSPPVDRLIDLVTAARLIADSVWIAVERLTPALVDLVRDSTADGIVVMLTPPGQAGHHADLSKLDGGPAVPAHDLSLGVDGGVTADSIDALQDACVTYAVAGRGLLATPTHPLTSADTAVLSPAHENGHHA
ncbi:hypothetical protein [Curtobacterium flaccumfaciens]|uniref:hypothetical protein n=1 Tax=Curtobacterium flaccumfaciens TaxID=2035 RepID=UPI001E435BB9|nr:hypothetical protein [Curtobacterium allii]MCE0459786.1 hypothetical protein [Curtobacterium allii]